MNISSAASRIGGLTGAAELEALYRLRKDGEARAAEEAAQKAQEAQNANTRSTFKMMDRHAEIVQKSQEQNNERAEKLAVQKLADKRAEERDAAFADMAVRNDERRDLLKARRPEYM